MASGAGGAWYGLDNAHSGALTGFCNCPLSFQDCVGWYYLKTGNDPICRLSLHLLLRMNISKRLD